MDLRAELIAEATSFETAMAKGVEALAKLQSEAKRLNSELDHAKTTMASLGSTSEATGEDMEGAAKAAKDTADAAKAAEAQAKQLRAELQAQGQTIRNTIAAFQARTAELKSVTAEEKAAAAATRDHRSAMDRASDAATHYVAAMASIDRVGFAEDSRDRMMAMMREAGELRHLGAEYRKFASSPPPNNDWAERQAKVIADLEHVEREYATHNASRQIGLGWRRALEDAEAYAAGVKALTQRGLEDAKQREAAIAEIRRLQSTTGAVGIKFDPADMSSLQAAASQLKELESYQQRIAKGTADADRAMAEFNKGMSGADMRSIGQSEGARSRAEVDAQRRSWAESQDIEDRLRRTKAVGVTPTHPSGMWENESLANMAKARDRLIEIEAAQQRAAKMATALDAANAKFLGRWSERGGLERGIQGVQSLGREVEALGNSYGKTEQPIRQHTSALTQALKTAAELYLVYGTLRKAGGAFVAGIDYNATLEQSKLAIASVVSANEKVADSQGRQITGLEKLKIAQGQVAVIMDDLVTKARETGTPIKTLVEGFQAAIAPASAMGMSLDTTKDIVIGMTNAMKAMNVPIDQQRQEIQDILNTDIDRNSNVAKNLQLNSAILKLWKEQGTLGEHMLELLKDYNVAAKEYKNTWAGATAVMKGNFDVLMGVMTKGSFDVLKQEAKRVSDILSGAKQDSGTWFGVDEIERAKRWGVVLKDGVQGALVVAEALAATIARPIDGLTRLWLLAKAGPAIVAAHLAFGKELKAGFSELTAIAPVSSHGPNAGKITPPILSQEQAKRLQSAASIGTLNTKTLMKEGLSPTQIQKVLEVYGRASTAREAAFGVGTGELTWDDYQASVHPAASGPVKISPAGSPSAGTLTAAQKTKNLDKLNQDLSNAYKAAHGNAIKGFDNEIAILNKAISEAKSKGFDIEHLRRKLEGIKSDRETALQRAQEKAAKAAEAAARKAAKDALAEPRPVPHPGMVFGPLTPIQEQRIQDAADEKTREKWFVKAEAKGKVDSNRLRKELAKIDQDSGRRMGGIASDEALSMAEVEQDPSVRLAKEIEIRQKAITDEYNARKEDAESLAMTDMNGRMEGLRKAEAFKAEAEAQLRADERVGRMQIAKDIGEMQKDFAMQAAQLAAGFAVKAIKGEKTTAGDVISGSGGLVGGVAGAILGSIVPGIGTLAGAGMGSQIGGIVGTVGGALVDQPGIEQAKANEAQQKAADDLRDSAKKLWDAAEEQKKAAFLQQDAAMKDLIGLGESLKLDIARQGVENLPKEKQAKAKAILDALPSAFRAKADAEAMGETVSFNPDVTKAMADPNYVLTMTSGGRVPGIGFGDTVPALLTPGEFVIPKDKVAALFSALPGVQHFAAGGEARPWWNPFGWGEKTPPPPPPEKMITSRGEAFNPRDIVGSVPIINPSQSMLVGPDGKLLGDYPDGITKKTPPPPPPAKMIISSGAETVRTRASAGVATEEENKALALVDGQNRVGDLIQKLIDGNIARDKASASRGTQQNPMIVAPPKGSPFDFAPKAWFMRGGRGSGTRSIRSGGALPGLNKA